MPDLTFLGAGSAFNVDLDNTSAYFFRDDTLYLLDCGATVFSAAVRTGILYRAKRIVVAVTHLHADHCGSLGSLILYQCGLKAIAVVCANPQIHTLLAINGVREHQYESYASYDRDGVVIKPVPTRHTHLEAYSLEIAADGERIFYSGDTCVLPETLFSDLESGRIAHVYTEAMDMMGAPSGKAHLSLDDLISSVPEHLRSRFTLMHLNCDYSARIKALGFGCAADKLYTKED